MIRVAAAQMRSGESPDANLEAMEVMVADAVGRGARYVLTPEVSVAFAANKERLAEVAGPETSDGAFARLGELARTHGVHLHLGSLAVALEDGRFANRSVLFGPDGDVVASYDKIHLFDADVPGDKGYRESATYRGGDTAVVAGAAGFGLGFSVTIDPAASLLPGSVGDMSWGGAASTYFWIDPKEELICIFMTQFMPSTFHNVRRELRTLVYSSILD